MNTRDDLKWGIMTVWFIGPWMAIIHWITTYHPTVALWATVCAVWFVIWIKGGNRMAVKLFPERFPDYGRRKDKKNK